MATTTVALGTIAGKLAGDAKFAAALVDTATLTLRPREPGHGNLLTLMGALRSRLEELAAELRGVVAGLETNRALGRLGFGR